MDNHTRAYEELKTLVDLWWNGNITRLELILKIATTLAWHEAMEGGN